MKWQKNKKNMKPWNLSTCLINFPGIVFPSIFCLVSKNVLFLCLSLTESYHRTTTLESMSIGTGRPRQQQLGATHGVSTRATSGCASLKHVNTQCWAETRGGCNINWLTSLSSKECFELGSVTLLLLVFLFQSVLVFVWNHGAFSPFLFDVQVCSIAFWVAAETKNSKMPYTLQEEGKRNSLNKRLFFKQALLLIRGSKNNQPPPLLLHTSFLSKITSFVNN